MAKSKVEVLPIATRQRGDSGEMPILLGNDLGNIKVTFDGELQKAFFRKPMVMWSTKRNTFVIRFGNDYIDVGEDYYDPSDDSEIIEEFKDSPTNEDGPEADRNVFEDEQRNVYGDLSFFNGEWSLENIIDA
jgi:hypothetical protein